MKQSGKYVIGIDYGTDSVRAVIIDASTGATVASSVFEYPRWKEGLYCDPVLSMYRQHPQDYIDGLRYAVRECLALAGSDVASRVCAIGVDTTGSTPVAAGADGMPLALSPTFRDDPDAMFVLWKDHTSIPEAEMINSHARNQSAGYLKYVGGIYSSEWFWAKMFNVLSHNGAVAAACHTWVEHCDWIPFLLTGGKEASQIMRSTCAAGHKGLYSPEWNGFPPAEFFEPLNAFVAQVAGTLPSECYPCGTVAGTLSSEWAADLGLAEDVIVSTGALDAHIGAVGGMIRPGYMSMVIGTSTCDMLVAPAESMAGKQLVPGICGSVQDSIIPGMIGMEAGQSAFGDIYAWFANLLAWPASLSEGGRKNVQDMLPLIMEHLNKQAAAMGIEPGSEIALDWFNGRRTPDADQTLKGAITNLTLASSAPRIFRALVESTCFGTKAIVERFEQYGVPVEGIIALGGISRKSPFVMQSLADVMGMPILVSRSEQTCALGSAMFAAVAAGIYAKVEDAMEAMGGGFDMEYHPDPALATLYAERYDRYLALGRSM